MGYQLQENGINAMAPDCRWFVIAVFFAKYILQNKNSLPKYFFQWI